MFPGPHGIYFPATMSLGPSTAEEFYGFSVAKK